jgi:type III secretion system chaperone SycN
MSWIHETVSAFGRQIGVDNLAFNAQGVFHMQLQSGGVLGVEMVRRGQADEILIYLGRPLGFDGAALQRRALMQAHVNQAHAEPVQVATRGDSPEALLIMALRMPQRDFTLPALGRSVDYLNRWFDGVRRV